MKNKHTKEVVSYTKLYDKLVNSTNKRLASILKPLADHIQHELIEQTIKQQLALLEDKVLVNNAEFDLSNSPEVKRLLDAKNLLVRNFEVLNEHELTHKQDKKQFLKSPQYKELLKRQNNRYLQSLENIKKRYQTKLNKINVREHLQEITPTLKKINDYLGVEDWEQSTILKKKLFFDNPHLTLEVINSNISPTLKQDIKDLSIEKLFSKYGKEDLLKILHNLTEHKTAIIHKGLSEELSKLKELNLRYRIEDKKFAKLNTKKNQLMREQAQQKLNTLISKIDFKESFFYETDRTAEEFVRDMVETTSKASGVTLYVWGTMRDDKVRPDHQKLSYTIQDYNNPPHYNSGLGVANPGEDYNCRCIAIPISPFSPLNNRQLIGVRIDPQALTNNSLALEILSDHKAHSNSKNR